MKTLPIPLLATVSCRLLPFMLPMYIIALLGRANVVFARLRLQADKGLELSERQPATSAIALIKPLRAFDGFIATVLKTGVNHLRFRHPPASICSPPPRPPQH